MAWSWTASGRVDAFEYELVPVASVNGKPSGKLTGVTGGQLNFNYYSTEKVSGKLEVVDTGFVKNCYVRVWYKPTLPGEGSKKIELATCFASTERSHYADGTASCGGSPRTSCTRTSPRRRARARSACSSASSNGSAASTPSMA